MFKSKLTLLTMCVGALSLLNACSSNTGFQTGAAGSLGGASQSPQFATEFYKGDTLIYSDSPAIGLATMVAGENYTVKVKPLNSVSATFTIKVIDRDTGSTALNQAATPNQAIAFTFPDANDYQVVTVANPKSGSPITKTVNIAVACSDVDSVFAVNSAAINVTASGSNKFTYSSTGVAPAGDDFECAWDFNGDGILDREYADCNKNVEAISNHVGARELAVSVRKISCNTSMFAKKTMNVQEPIAGAGINFIRGDVSQPGDATNKRTNLTHSSTNNAGLVLALCDYNDDAGIWSIHGANNYYSTADALSLPTSKQHGMTLSISGAPRNGVTEGPINTANAKISNSRFITDAQSDGLPQFTFRTSTCTLSNFKLTAMPVSGAPCAGGATLVEPGATVEASGEFTCSDMRSNENPLFPPVGVTNGKFYCIFHIGDSCIGGGGGGGGGIPPIVF